MPRIRTVKPEFWSSEQVLECSMSARLLFIGLWNFCDDAGRHKYSLKQIKAEVLPADDVTLDDIRGMIDELSDNDLVTPYFVEGQGYLQVNGWHHQRIDKAQAPKHPGIEQADSTNGRGTLPPEGKGRERKGDEGVTPRASAREQQPAVAGESESLPIASTEQQPDRFEEWWHHYPSKVAKVKAKQKWRQKRLDRFADQLIDDVKNRAANDRRWIEGYVPNPTTYLNQERWNDDVQKPAPNGAGRPGGDPNALGNYNRAVAAAAAKKFRARMGGDA